MSVRWIVTEVTSGQPRPTRVRSAATASSADSTSAAKGPSRVSATPILPDRYTSLPATTPDEYGPSAPGAARCSDDDEQAASSSRNGTALMASSPRGGRP